MRHLVVLIAAVTVLGASAPPRGQAWSRVVAPHFVVSGDASREDVRQVAFLLEMFRDVFARVLPGARDRTLAPPFVIVFGSDKAFQPFKPTMDGRALPVGGFVVRDAAAPCMALRLDRSGESYRTIFHEYAHVLFDAPRVPLWLSEGIADYYSTATVHRDRRRVLLGGLVPAHVAQLSRSLVSLRQLVATPRSARIWDGESGRVFYAESWALVHYLVRATPARGRQITRYLRRLEDGEGEAAAFEATIGPIDEIDAQFRRYVRSGMLPPEEVTLPARVAVDPLQARPMTEAEVEATLSRLLFQLERDEEARARLDAALALDPELPEAHATLGHVRLQQDRPAEAIGPLRRANAHDPENLLVAHDYALSALMAYDAQLAAPLEDAYSALERALGGADRAEAVAVLGTVAGRLGRLDEAESLLRRAAALAPRRLSTEVELADVCSRVGRFGEARDILSAAAATADGAAAESVAQHRGWLAMAESRARLRAELAVAAGLTDPGRDAAIGRTGRFPKPPGFRAPRAGERRAAGLLDAIDCAAASVVARVTTATGPLTLTAPRLHDVEAAAFRTDLGDVLVCGARERREPVYVTWTGVSRLVALEFLPLDLGPSR